MLEYQRCIRRVLADDRRTEESISYSYVGAWSNQFCPVAKHRLAVDTALLSLAEHPNRCASFT
jgi:hypothetical protein